MTTSNIGFPSVTTSEAVVWRRGGVLSTTAETAGYSAAGGRVDGIFERDAASGGDTTLRLLNTPGTFIVEVNGAITIGTLLYPAASGVFSATAVGNAVFRAVSATGATGGYCEVTRVNSGTSGQLRTVEAHTASDTLTTAESGSIHTTFGAGGAVTFTLPPAVVGLEYFFQVGAVQNLIVEPDAAETVSLPSNGVAQTNITANAVGESVHIMCCNAGTWAVMGFTGTWT